MPVPEIVSVTSDTAGALLRSGRVDLVMCPRLADADGQALYRVRLVAVGLGLTSPTLDFRALGGRPVATLPPDSDVRKLLERAAFASGMTLEVTYEDRDAAALIALARAGVCTAVLLDEAVPDNETTPTAVLVYEGREFTGEFWLNWRRGEALSPAAEAIRDALLTYSVRGRRAAPASD